MCPRPGPESSLPFLSTVLWIWLGVELKSRQKAQCLCAGRATDFLRWLELPADLGTPGIAVEQAKVCVAQVDTPRPCGLAVRYSWDGRGYGRGDTTCTTSCTTFHVGSSLSNACWASMHSVWQCRSLARMGIPARESRSPGQILRWTHAGQGYYRMGKGARIPPHLIPGAQSRIMIGQSRFVRLVLTRRVNGRQA